MGSDSRTVTIDIMRHGQKDGDALTPLGYEQVRAATRLHVLGMPPPLYVHYSGAVRTLQTINTVVETAGWENVRCNPDQGIHFDYSIAVTGGIDAYNAAEAKITENWGPRCVQTVSMWLATYPGSLILRGQVRYFLVWFASVMSDGAYSICASHSPTSELACVEPVAMPILNEADIVRYTLRTDEAGLMQVVGSEYLPCPAITGV